MKGVPGAALTRGISPAVLRVPSGVKNNGPARGARGWSGSTALILTAAVACGGGSPPDRSLDNLGADVARLQPGDRPVRFRLDTAVTPGVTDFTVETFRWAHTDLGDSGPLTIHVYSDEDHFVAAYTGEFAISAVDARRELADGQTAFTSPGGHIWIYLPNYAATPEDERRHALFHEYVHTLQEWLAEVQFQSEDPAARSFVPRWMVEGCAEYLAVQAGAKRGFLDADRQRAITVFRARRGAGAALSTLETAGQAGFLGGSGEAYTLGWLACERLATAHGPDSVTRRFWVAMASKRDWQAAFVDAFGVSPAAFYADFDAFQATL